MIGINGYSVDNINWFKDHEGIYIFQCDILYENIKIGEFSEDYMNGPDQMRFNDNFDSELNKIKEVAISFFDKYSSDESFIKNEDFFIRFLKSLYEANEELEDNQKIKISANYPYDYEIISDNKLNINSDDKNKLIINKNENLVISEKDNDYEI